MSQEETNFSDTHSRTDEAYSDYEIGFLAREEKDISEVLELARRHGAKVTFDGPWRRISLAYEIKKESQAFFGFFRFILPRENLAEFRKTLHMTRSLLRFLILQLTPTRKAKSVLDRVKIEIPKFTVKPESRVPLSNEALEKKIEEILQ